MFIFKMNDHNSPKETQCYLLYTFKIKWLQKFGKESKKSAYENENTLFSFERTFIFIELNILKPEFPTMFERILFLKRKISKMDRKKEDFQ